MQEARVSDRSKILVCYSHSDRRWLDRLLLHLKPLDRNALIDLWDDNGFNNMRRQDELREAINVARVIVLLVSADFLASDFNSGDLGSLLVSAQAHGAVVFPVIVSPCRFEADSLSRFQPINSPASSLVSMSRSAQDMFWVKLLRDIIGVMQGESLPPSMSDVNSTASLPSSQVEGQQVLRRDVVRPSPLLSRYIVVQDIGRLTFDLTVPTYILDPNFFLIDWNPAFDEVLAKPLKLVRGRDHAQTIFRALANPDESLKHARQAFEGDRMRLVDSETLVFRSLKYGEVRFLKIAAQIIGSDGTPQGWSVALNVINAGSGDGFWPDVMARIEEEVKRSRYATVYDSLVLALPEYHDLVKLVIAQIGGARRCIDLGAGTGNGSIRLLETDPHREVWAVEINETMLRHFRAKLAELTTDGRDYADRLTILKDDINRLDGLPGETFDAAIMINTLVAIRDVDLCLRSAHRILKPGGILSISTPHRATDVVRLFAQLQHALEDKGLFDRYQEQFEVALAYNEMDDLLRRNTEADILRQVADAGFTVEAVYPDQYVSAVVVIKAIKTPGPATRADDFLESASGTS